MIFDPGKYTYTVDNTTNLKEGLLLNPHCPLDYCQRDELSFTLNDTDAQCQYNRTGLLCGECKQNLSFVLGSSRCLPCSNNYLSLLIVFALAGVFLVIFLSVLNLTVSVGTMNGLVFYANIVIINRAQLLPSDKTNILTIFLAWMNLDFGIEVCFYEKMTAYDKAWLNFVFPLYLWALVLFIIVASNYSMKMSRLFSCTNPVALLATLNVLSYTKCLRSVITVLIPAYVGYYSSDPKRHLTAVWLYDGNVLFLHGKHIYLFVFALLFLLLMVPFTLLLLLGQRIQTLSEKKCFLWISDYRMKTYLDVYHGPFKDNQGYWCGLLLVIRCCLHVVPALYALNLVALALVMMVLLVVLLWFKVYKEWYQNALEAFSIINLLILSISTLFVEEENRHYQDAIGYASVSVAFATFCGIVIYHSWLRLKDTVACKKLATRFKSSTANNLDSLVEEDATDPLCKNVHQSLNLVETV